ncbi:MAG: bifunctional phosphoglucose/phosphomannose isomerase, partial [Methanomassiliicoccales archaeon]|nr:bifunctional phosphoglucose/phosphomannose isomerase [Methanomassiliicoccales archaeon]
MIISERIIVHLTNHANVPELLDDIKYIKRIDKSNMFSCVERFPKQLEESLSVSSRLSCDVDKVCVCGLGGSAIAGDIVSEYLSERSDVMVSVVRGIRLPAWIDDDTLTIIISYSGDTRETLELFNDASKVDSPLIAITSGGELRERCERRNVPVVIIPPGIQPRAAIGHSLGAIASVLDGVGVSTPRLTLTSLLKDLTKFKDDLVPGVPTSLNLSKHVAKILHNRTPIVYAPRCMKPAAIRWQTQINENAKMMAFSGEIPEMNHNQIVGWIEDENARKCVPVVLNSGSCGDFMKRIVGKTVEMLEENGPDPVLVEVPGEDNL